MKHPPLHSTVLLLALLGGATAQAQLTYSSSWFANTFAQQTKNVQTDVRDIHVRPDGTIYVTQEFNEGDGNCGIYKNGDKIGRLDDNVASAWGRQGGLSLTSDGTYVYTLMKQEGGFGAGYPPSGEYWHCVRRYNMDGSRAPYSGGQTLWDNSGLIVNANGAQPRGIEFYNGELYVSDPTGSGSIKVFNPGTRAQNRSWAFSNPGSIAVDSAGTLWILQGTTVVHQNTSGGNLAGSFTLPAGFVPGPIKIDSQNRLLIANRAQDQRIHIYGNLGGTPSEVGTFGVAGGIHSGTGATIGTYGPQRFCGPMAADTDANGNLIVAMDGYGEQGGAGWGGFVLESYNFGSGARNWALHGLMFVDCADADPSSETDVFTNDKHFVMDYSKPAGQEWTYKGHTINHWKFPNDLRHRRGPDEQASVWVRRINGKRFLFSVGMYAGRLGVYRFNESTDGETAIPYAIFSRDHMGLGWIPSEPASGQWIWRDANGNGQMEAGEYSQPAGGGNFDGWGWWVDAAGNVWQTGNGTTLRRFAVQGSDANGNPIWSYSSSPNTYTPPSQFTELLRAEYDSANDVMFLSGYTSANPNPNGEWGTVGTTISRYNSWGTGNRTAAWNIVLPRPQRPDGSFTMIPKAMTVAKDYLFVGYYNAQRTPLTKVYRTSDGGFVGDMTPSFAGTSLEGDVDIPYGIRAYARANGQYLIFQEYDIPNKILMYRWCPSGNCPEGGGGGGTGAGLTGFYYNNKTLAPPVDLARTEAVDFAWSAAPGTGINADNFSVRWTGQVEAPSSGSYTFRTVSDDGVRLWINGSQVINNWTDHGPTANDSAAINLTAGTKYNAVMEFYEATGGAEARLQWKLPGGTTFAAIPSTRLYNALPAPWATADIGGPGVAGSTAYNPVGGLWTVNGGGADIWNAADQFRFVSQPGSGDCEIKARVSYEENTDPWAKAGVMIRETTAAGSTHALMCVSAANGFRLQSRSSTGGGSADVSGGALNASPNNWVRLVRSGSTITGYKSADGSTWTPVGSVTITMAASVQIGLAVTAHNNTTLSTVTFDNVTAVP